MSSICTIITRHFNKKPRFSFPFEPEQIPQNGIYVLFQKGEQGHGMGRIVRIGTHTGNNQLLSRLHQHFLMENKDRSIFRKNIGRALLNKRNDPYLEVWELDLTTRKAKERHDGKVNKEYQKEIEQEVSSYIQNNFTFAVFQVDEKQKRLALESKLISTVSWCDECRPSPRWIGFYSSKAKIRESGLWQVNELYKEPLREDELVEL